MNAGQKSTFISFTFNVLVVLSFFYICYVYNYSASLWFLSVVFDSLYSGFELTHQSYLYVQFLLPMLVHNFGNSYIRFHSHNPSHNYDINNKYGNNNLFSNTDFNFDLSIVVNSSNNHLVSVFNTPVSLTKSNLPIRALFEVVNLSPKSTNLITLTTTDHSHVEYQLLSNKYAYYFNLVNSPVTLVPKSTNSFDNIWVNTLLHSELLNKPGFIKGNVGSFYIKDFTWHDLNNLVVSSGVFSQLSDNLRDQTRMIELHRWLYKYNVLHRKTLINSHKTTMAKKLLSTGFYDSTLSTSNIWASDFFSKTSEHASKILKNEFRLLYNDMHIGNSETFGSKFELGLSQPKTTFKLLSFYETSFHFYIKRFFLFNNLGANNVATSVYNSTNSTTALNLPNITSYRLLNTAMWLSPITANDIFNISLPSTKPAFNHQSNDLTCWGKDVTLILSDSDALSNDQLETALDLTGSIMTINPYVHYHSIVGGIIDQIEVDTDVDFTPSVKLDLVNYRLNYAFVDTQLLNVASSVITVK